jgi:hypothetical protein
MISATGLRRASWLGALGISMFMAGPLPAQPTPPPAQPTPPVVTVFSHASKYHLDMHLAPVPKPLAEQLELKGQGVLVVRVSPDGPAAKAGVKAHDIVLAVGDTPVKGPSDLMDALDKSEGKELSLKLMRAGKPITVAITPENRSEGAIGLGRMRIEVTKEVRELENRIRERLKEAGGDMRMEFFQPGRLPPPGARLGIQSRPEFPDDLSVTIHKQGKEPAEIEVKKGDQTWKVKDNELAQLPEEVRKYVEGMLGHGPMGWNISVRRPDGPPRDGPGAPPEAYGADHGYGGPPRPHGPLPRPEDRPDYTRPGASGYPIGPIELQERKDDQRGHRTPGGLERRLSEMGREMHRIHQQIEDLRRSLHEDRDEEEIEELEN